MTMSEKTRIAESYHERGYGCAQAVLGAFCADFDLDEEIALRISTGFGSGMGRLCEVCGALTGGFMVIGLKYGKVITDGAKYGSNTEQTYALVAELAQRFRDQYGTIKCRELTGLDLSDPDQRQRARDEGVFKNDCAGYICRTVEILEDII
jgi:C_GCAxxG_C_C family probable redox protein